MQTISHEIMRRTITEPDASKPLAERIDLQRLNAALDMPVYMNRFVVERSERSKLDLQTVKDLFETVPPECGTVGCIAGNVLLNELPEGLKTRKQVEIHFTNDLYISPADSDGYRFEYTGEQAVTQSGLASARRILGLTPKEADVLFYTQPPYHLVLGSFDYQTWLKQWVVAWLGSHGVAVRLVDGSFEVGL